MKRNAWIAIGLILLIGAFARFFRLDEKSLWSDEVATIATSLGNSIDPEAYVLSGKTFDPPFPVSAGTYVKKATLSHGAANWGQTAQVLKANVHPPLFFWLMNLWISQFGLQPGTLRIPAVLFGILAIGLMYGLAVRLGRFQNQWASSQSRLSQPEAQFPTQGFALLAAAFMAFSAYQIDHAQDARQYTLLICLALSAVWLLVGLIQSQPSKWTQWALLALILAAGLYTQYFFMVFAAFVMGYWAWQKRHERKQLMGVLGCALWVALYVLPWVPLLREQLVFLKIAGHYTAGLWNPFQLPEKLWRIVCEFFLPSHSLGKIMPLLMLGMGTLSFWQTRQQSLKSGPTFGVSPVFRLIFIWLVFLLGGQIVLDLLKDSHTATIRRYLLLASPAVYLLMAYGICRVYQSWRHCRWRWLPVLFTVVLLACMISDSYQKLLLKHVASDEFKQAAEWINRQRHTSAPSKDDWVLVSKTGAMAVGMAYYLTPDTPMLGVDVPTAQTLAPKSVTLNTLSERARSKGPHRLWLVFSHAAPSTRTRLTQWAEAAGYRQTDALKVPGVRVLAFQSQKRE